MRVDVHDAGRQREAAGVHALAGGAEVAADRGDAPTGDGHATRPWWTAETVDDDGIVDHEIVHRGDPSRA